MSSNPAILHWDNRPEAGDYPFNWTDTDPAQVNEPEPPSERVTQNHEVWGGFATVAGSRVPVFMVADLEAEGESVDDIQGRYPHLTRADIYAALSYAHAFDGVIDQERDRYQEVVARYKP